MHKTARVANANPVRINVRPRRSKIEAIPTTSGIASRAKVVWFFSSEQNCFLKPLSLLTYFSNGLLRPMG